MNGEPMMKKTTQKGRKEIKSDNYMERNIYQTFLNKIQLQKIISEKKV